jgi:hypothetical protein
MPRMAPPLAANKSASPVSVGQTGGKKEPPESSGSSNTANIHLTQRHAGNASAPPQQPFNAAPSEFPLGNLALLPPAEIPEMAISMASSGTASIEEIGTAAISALEKAGDPLGIKDCLKPVLILSAPPLLRPFHAGAKDPDKSAIKLATEQLKLQFNDPQSSTEKKRCILSFSMQHYAPTSFCKEMVYEMVRSDPDAFNIAPQNLFEKITPPYCSTNVFHRTGDTYQEARHELCNVLDILDALPPSAPCAAFLAVNAPRLFTNISRDPRWGVEQEETDPLQRVITAHNAVRQAYPLEREQNLLFVGLLGVACSRGLESEAAGVKASSPQVAMIAFEYCLDLIEAEDTPVINLPPSSHLSPFRYFAGLGNLLCRGAERLDIDQSHIERSFDRLLAAMNKVPARPDKSPRSQYMDLYQASYYAIQAVHVKMPLSTEQWNQIKNLNSRHGLELDRLLPLDWLNKYDPEPAYFTSR